MRKDRNSIKNPLYWRGVAIAEFAVATDASYSGFFYNGWLRKLKVGIESMDEVGSIDWIVGKFQRSQWIDIRKAKNKSTSKETTYVRTGKEHWAGRPQAPCKV